MMDRMDKAQRVIAKATSVVEPGPKEVKRVDSVSEKVLALVKTRLEEVRPRPEVVLGGSYAKGTWLSGEVDIDIFVKFSTSIRKIDLEKILIPIGLESLSGYNPYLRYSEHPYVEAIVDKVKINIVGCFDVKQGEWRSSADRSPYHTVMIQSKFDTKLRVQSRLLKRFLKSNLIYGAEIQTQGFSGYVCEVLILKFGSFMGVVRMAQELGKNSVIALEEDHYKYSSLHRSSLIILDPVDPHRNLGAAISKKNVARFILASHCFIQRPLLRYFVPGRISTKIQKHEVFQNQLVMAKFQHTERSADILWGQLRRTITRVEKQLTIRGFRVLRSSAATDNKTKSALLLLLERTELDPIAVKRGPEVSMIDGAKIFLKKNFINSKMTWIGVDGKLYVSDIRHGGDIVSHLKELLTSGISSSGVAPRLTKQLAETLKIVKGPKVLVESERNVWLKEALVDVIGTDIVICSPA